MQRRILTGIVIGLLLAGITAAAVGCMPYERMQAAGALVRRTDDFTPERFARFRHVCWFFALTLPAVSLGVWRRRRGSPSETADEASPTDAAADGESGATWLIWSIVAVGFALRWQRLFDPVAYDEAYTYLNFASRPWYEAIGDYNSTNNHLLNTLLMHVSTRIFGPHEWAMRWHVLLAGGLLPWAVFAWARDWFGKPAALVTAAAIAVSPALITYSTDARGYMLIALAAVVLDGSLARLARRQNPRAWWSAWGALVAGLCSMPLMLYAAVSSSGWFVLLPLVERRGWGNSFNRLRTAGRLWGLAIPAVAAFYSLAYVFRGLMFLHDPIMQSTGADSYWTSLWSAWTGAFDWWTDGVLPNLFWGILALVGLVLMPGHAARLRWGLPFAVVLMLNIVQHVAPPPRIYLHLSSWLFVAAAIGLIGLLHASRRPALRNGMLAAAVLLLAGTNHAFRHPLLFHAAERANFVSVPDVIEAVEQSLTHHPGERSVLLAPLPCDLPSIFYLRRAGIELPVNARPEPGDRIYLIARPAESPDDVLATPLLNMAALAPQIDGWLTISRFETLTLYAAQMSSGESRRNQQSRL